ncbi:MAG: hypothetical protein S4CHLAM102_06550 [Chlamydiia bacterium]|nr:hypothetical protein [Chlamydiia bacterium]
MNAFLLLSPREKRPLDDFLEVDIEAWFGTDKRQKTDPATLMRQIETSAKVGDIEATLAHLSDIDPLDPLLPQPASVITAQAHLMLIHFHSATSLADTERCFTLLKSEDTEASRSRIPLATCLLAITHADEDQLVPAEMLLDSIKHVPGSSVGSHFMRARCAIALGYLANGQLNKSTEQMRLTSLEGLAPQELKTAKACQSIALGRLIPALEQSGGFQEASRLATTFHLQGDTTYYLEMSKSFEEAGDLKRSIEYFAKVVSSKSDSAYVKKHLQLGRKVLEKDGPAVARSWLKDNPIEFKHAQYPFYAAIMAKICLIEMESGELTEAKLFIDKEQKKANPTIKQCVQILSSRLQQLEKRR